MLSNSNFWVLIAFAVFWIVAFRPVAKAVVGYLDGRAERIRRELAEAERLREEAQRTLADYQRRQRDALKEAEDIVARAKEDAARMRAAAQADLDRQIKRREEQALASIAQAEAAALAEVRDVTVDVAIAASREVLAAILKGPAAAKLVDDAIAGLGDRLH
jgi:F-type H+-transporting ATPase subunit b